MPIEYQGHFQQEQSAEAYDLDQYAPDSYWDVLWQIERNFLDSVVHRLREKKAVVRYLDFACGTGRVLAHLEQLCDESLGVDVSEAMLARARVRVRKASLVCGDITVQGAPVEGRYDLITAFRFLLNAGPELRRAAVGALAARLRDPESRLVVNCHGNSASYKAVLMPFRALRSRITGRPTENLMWPSDVRRLLRTAGLEILETYGVGILPGALLSRIPRKQRLAVEQRLRTIWPLSQSAVDQIYVCRRP